MTTTGSVNTLTSRSLPPPAALKVQASPAQYLTFTGSLVNPAGKTASYTFAALCGISPPQPTGGWAKWNTVDRPEQVGMTVIGGYDPASMDVQLRFEAVTADYLDRLNGTPNASAQQVENDIQKLVWMSGRGKLFAQDGGVGMAALGDSPIVKVYSADSNGDQRPLVPPDFQGIQWVVTNLNWDAAPIRNARGYRTRQDVTVSLLQYVQDQFSLGADSSSARAKAKAGVAGQYKIVTTTAAMDTVLKVANQVCHDPSAAPAILLANKDVNGIGTSIRKVLYPPPRRLKVPLQNIKNL